MKTIREQFEEIWPVPKDVYWMPLSSNGGEYMADPRIKGDDDIFDARCRAQEWDARLDTFTRCQESQAIVTSLNDELVETLKLCNTQLCSLLDPAEYLSDDQLRAIELAGITLAKARGEK